MHFWASSRTGQHSDRGRAVVGLFRRVSLQEGSLVWQLLVFRCLTQTPRYSHCGYCGYWLRTLPLRCRREGRLAQEVLAGETVEQSLV